MQFLVTQRIFKINFSKSNVHMLDELDANDFKIIKRHEKTEKKILMNMKLDANFCDRIDFLHIKPLKHT